jgi:predicted transcriptional regulator/anti-sigma regulatory factor (Ser/Thr protein kinase)
MNVLPQIPIDTDKSSPIIVDLIYRLKVRDVMTTTVHTCRSDDTMRSVQRTMREEGMSGMPVVDGDRLVGIISMDDVISSLDEGRIEETVSHHMSRNVIVLEDDMPLSFAISHMEKYRFGRFPVLNAEKKLVGIITSRDVLIALLVEINTEIERFEQQALETDGDADGFRLEYATRKFDFETAGRISTETKKMLKERGLPPRLIRRVAVASYELEMNQVVHSLGGSVVVRYAVGDEMIEITAHDVGPGIPDVDAALTEGFSTATEWVRSLGFGAGMGLPNVRRVSDEFDIESDTRGTRVRAIIHTGGDQR